MKIKTSVRSRSIQEKFKQEWMRQERVLMQSPYYLSLRTRIKLIGMKTRKQKLLSFIKLKVSFLLAKISRKLRLPKKLPFNYNL